MPDWLQLIQSNHAIEHPNDGFELFVCPPATDTEMDELGRTVGSELPQEFRSLYTTCNGFGVKHPGDEPATIWWFVRPTNQLQSFGNDVRNWFQKTHGKFAARFFPFIDYSNGDVLGYVKDESGLFFEGLFFFRHEHYQFSGHQDINDFLSHLPITLEEFLTRVCQNIGNQ